MNDFGTWRISWPEKQISFISSCRYTFGLWVDAIIEKGGWPQVTRL